MVGRVLQGGATGIAIPLMFNLVVERVPRQRLGFYMGLLGMVVSLAPALGPTYGGAMIARFDWHMIYTCIMPVPIISFIIAYLNLKDSPQKGKRPFDVWSFLLLSVALISSLVAISSLEDGHGINWLYVLVFLITFVLFIWRSLRVEHPFLDIRILRLPVIFLGIWPFLIFQFSNLSANFLIPNFLVAQGASTTSSGFSLLPGTLIGALLAPSLGKLYDTKGPKLSLYGGNLLAFLAMLVFALFTDWLNLSIIIGFYIVFTLGRNMAFSNTQAYATAHVSHEKTADVTALFQLAQTFAGAVGTAVAAVMVNAAPNISAGGNHIFWMITLLIGFNFVFYVALFRRADRAQSDH